MNVILSKEKTTPLAYLKAGDTFKYDGIYYMKVENKHRDKDLWNAVNLNSGILTVLLPSVNIEPIKGSFVEE